MLPEVHSTEREWGSLYLRCIDAVRESMHSAVHGVLHVHEVLGVLGVISSTPLPTAGAYKQR